MEQLCQNGERDEVSLPMHFVGIPIRKIRKLRSSTELFGQVHMHHAMSELALASVNVVTVAKRATASVLVANPHDKSCIHGNSELLIFCILFVLLRTTSTHRHRRCFQAELLDVRARGMPVNGNYESHKHGIEPALVASISW